MTARDHVTRNPQAGSGRAGAPGRGKDASEATRSRSRDSDWSGDDTPEPAGTTTGQRNERSADAVFSNEREAVHVDETSDTDQIVHGDQLAGQYGGDIESSDYGNEPHAVRSNRAADTPRSTRPR